MKLETFERINRGVRLYEELKKLPLTKREREIIVRSTWTLSEDFSVKVIDRNELKIEIEEGQREIFTKESSNVLYYYLIVSEDGYIVTDTEKKVKENWDLSKRMILCEWVNHTLRVFIQNKKNRVYSSYQKNIARIMGVKLD